MIVTELIADYQPHKAQNSSQTTRNQMDYILAQPNT